MYTMRELQNLFQDMAREFDYDDTWDFQGSRSSLQAVTNVHQSYGRMERVWWHGIL